MPPLPMARSPPAKVNEPEELFVNVKPPMLPTPESLLLVPLLPA